MTLAPVWCTEYTKLARHLSCNGKESDMNQVRCVEVKKGQENYKTSKVSSSFAHKPTTKLVNKLWSDDIWISGLCTCKERNLTPEC